MPVEQMWTAAGFADKADIVMYGDGLFPTLRVEVADADKLRGVLHKVGQAIGPELAEQVSGGTTYWTIDNKDNGHGAAIVAVVHAHDFEVAVMMKDQLTARLPAIISGAPPAQSMRGKVDLAAIAKDQHTMPGSLVLVDTGRLFAELGKVPKLGIDTPACRDDLARIATIAPRMIGGYTSIDGQKASVRLAFELDPLVAHTLGTLRVPTPTVSKDPVAAMSIGVDLDGALAFVTTAAGALHAHPFTCEALAELNTGATEIAAALATNLPPELHGLRGFVAALDDLALDPPSGKGTVVVLGSQLGTTVPGLLGKVPGMGGMKLTAGGPPIDLPVGILMMGLPPASMALGTDRVVIGVGPDANKLAAAGLAAKADPHAPLASFYWNVRWFVQHLPQLTASSPTLAQYEDMTGTFDIVGNALIMDFAMTWANDSMIAK
jgi:hypothetical protein